MQSSSLFVFGCLDRRNETFINRGLALFGLFLFAAYLLPFHVSPFRAFFNDWLAVFGVVILAAYFSREKIITLHLPWMAFLPIGLALAILTQTMLEMLSEPWDAFLPILYLLLAALTIVFGASITAQKDGAYKLCKALAVAHLTAGLISVVIASFQFANHEILFAPFMMLMKHGPDISLRPYANLGQSNHLALLFCIAMASAWWLFQRAHIKGYMAGLVTLALLWGLVLTQSRIGWIILPVFVIVIQVLNAGADYKKVSWKVTAGLTTVYATLVLLLPKIGELLGVTVAPITKRMLGESPSGARSERLELFQQAWQMSIDNPWFGAGWFQFGPQQVTRSDFESSIYSHYAHNIVLNFAAELGWPITIAVFLGFIIWFYRCCLSKLPSLETGFALLVFLAVIVHSMVEYPLWYAIVLVPFALLVGMVHQERLSSLKISLPQYFVSAIALGMAVNLLWIGNDYRRVVSGLNALEFEAMGLSMNSNAMQKPTFTVFPYMYDYFTLMTMPVNDKMTAEQIVFMERISKRFGGAFVLTKMSQAYAMNGKEDEAVNAMLTIKRLHHDEKYSEAYEQWRKAPTQYSNIFSRLPSPEDTQKINGKEP